MELNPEQEKKLREAMVELRNKMARELENMDKLLEIYLDNQVYRIHPTREALTQEDGTRALWLVHYVDTSSEYGELEKMVRDLRELEEKGKYVQ